VPVVDRISARLARRAFGFEKSPAVSELLESRGSVAEGGWGEGVVVVSGWAGPGDAVGVWVAARVGLAGDVDVGVVFEVVAALAVGVGVAGVGGAAG
jgi:hypothetical protein